MTLQTSLDIIFLFNPPKAVFRYRKSMIKAVSAITSYFQNSIAEMKKVVWPTKKQTRAYTITVIILSLGMALFFGVLDYVFNLGLGTIIR